MKIPRYVSNLLLKRCFSHQDFFDETYSKNVKFKLYADIDISESEFKKLLRKFGEFCAKHSKSESVNIGQNISYDTHGLMYTQMSVRGQLLNVLKEFIYFSK